MRKKFFICVIAVLCIALLGYLITYRFKIDSTKVAKIEVSISGESGLEDKTITDKGDIEKVVDYFNSLILVKSISRPKDAVDGVALKDKNDKVICTMSWGESGILWSDRNTYLFGKRRINNLTKLLKECVN